MLRAELTPVVVRSIMVRHLSLLEPRVHRARPHRYGASRAQHEPQQPLELADPTLLLRDRRVLREQFRAPLQHRFAPQPRPSEANLLPYKIRITETFYERECQGQAPPRLDAKPFWTWHSAPWLDLPDRQRAVCWMSQSLRIGHDDPRSDDRSVRT